MPEGNLAEYIEAANAPLTDPEITRTVGASPARFEIYHFALSLCSQKVRTCLVEKGASFIAHDINVQLPLLGNYDPAYVRLRLLGGRGRPLVGGYTGRSSTSSEGFDPAVVPTLVDLEEQQVHVDSLRICEHIDAAYEGSGRLIAEDRALAIRSELAIVDATPHVALLYGAHPDVDFRPERLKQNMPGVHDRKIAKIEQARALAGDDSGLVAAYDAKLQKEARGQSVCIDPRQNASGRRRGARYGGWAGSTRRQRVAVRRYVHARRCFLGHLVVSPKMVGHGFRVARRAPTQWNQPPSGRSLCRPSLCPAGVQKGGHRLA